MLFAWAYTLVFSQGTYCLLSSPAFPQQALFFTYTGLSTQDGFKWMGVMTIGMTALYMLMYFPQWGGMFLKAKEGVTEEDYYLAEWTPEERSQVRDTTKPGLVNPSERAEEWV